MNTSFWPETLNLWILLVLLMLGNGAGRWQERRHDRNIRRREQAPRDVLALSTRCVPKGVAATGALLVSGGVVISSDHFKTFVAGFRDFFGGRSSRPREPARARATRGAAGPEAAGARPPQQAGHRRALPAHHDRRVVHAVAGGAGLRHCTAHGPLSPPRLESRQPPDDLIERDEQALRELAWLLAASLAVLVLLVRATGFAARWLAPKLPFQHDVARAERLLDDDPAARQADAATPERRTALQSLADRVAAAMDQPPGMRVVVTDEPSERVNADATIGGRTRVFHGLLGRLPGEEALAALLAHEIAHVKHRHVAAGMGHGLAVALRLTVMSPDSGAQAAQAVLGGAARRALPGCSHDAGRQADAETLAASLALHGHGGGVAALFAVLPPPLRVPAPPWPVAPR
jgi:beta-barrel assembly-enhancing protease